MEPFQNLYIGPRGIAVKILNRVDRTDAYLDKLVDVELRFGDLSSQDKALLNELVHGVIRWERKLDWILRGFYRGEFSKCIPNLKNAMRVALYQIMFLENVPDYVAVNEVIEFVKKLQGEKSADLVNAVLRNIIRAKHEIRYPSQEEDTLNYYGTVYSHPNWLVKRWIARYGTDFAEKLMSENNERPRLTLRFNQIRVNREDFLKKLNEAELKYHESIYSPHFITLLNLTNITDWDYFKEGYFSIQDESAGLPCILLDPKSDDVVLDLCAAPGGKSSFISELMMNRGRIYAIDKYSSRISLMKKNVERLKLTNIHFLEADSEKLQMDMVDKVLVDVPCSGLGILTKRPEIKWKRDTDDIKKLTQLQKSLLESAAKLVKVGGIIVYSTSTVEPEENFEIVKDFIVHNGHFELVVNHPHIHASLIDQDGCISTFPNLHRMDGSFAAKILRKS
jgi:16S rRNA (cytosine967-C5)-methyltransferase